MSTGRSDDPGLSRDMDDRGNDQGVSESGGVLSLGEFALRLDRVRPRPSQDDIDRLYSGYLKLRRIMSRLDP